MSACRRMRLVSGLAPLLLIAAGCGGSSKRASAPSAATTSTQQPAATTSTQPSAATGSTRSPAAPARPGIVAGSADGVTAILHAGTHHPKVGRPWPIHFTVRRGNRAAKASVSYEYLFAGQIVARRSHYTFTGGFSDVFMWPSSAVGYPLTFRAVIVSGGTTINLDYPVQVIR